MEAKKTYKDSLFRAIFNDRARLARLYKALSGNEVSPEDIDINTLSGVFMNDIKNDISFCVGNKLVILLEHQSTWNPNMPLRFLWYLGNLYKSIVDKDIIYKGELVKIPSPEFYVLYNGTREIPNFLKLRLSDAFAGPSGYMELTADCYNINYPGGKEILDRCYELMAYSVFTAKTREYKNEGHSLFESIKRAIRYCESHDLMTDYFKNHESEVLTMVSFEWDADRAKKVAYEEGCDYGRIVTRKEVVLSLLKNKAPMNLITATTKFSPEEVEKIAKENRLAF